MHHKMLVKRQEAGGREMTVATVKNVREGTRNRKKGMGVVEQ